MKRHGPWRTLALDPTEDRSAIRRAYADKLRELDVDRDIEGFTRLRHARDHALVLAKGLATAEDDAATDEEDDWIGDQVAITDRETGDDAGDASVLERPDTEPQTAQPNDEPAEPTAPQVLLSILYPGGQTSEEGLSTEEWALAQPALAAILQQAEDSSIDEHAAIEGWLSHHLASAWPRSAWLLEPAAAAFGWMEESGQLTERPAVQYLNQRLRGMRFVNKVKQPGHVLHKAWTELSKPGPKGAFAFMRAGKDDVARLLAGIRERYPEIESYLDAERVASWEGTLQVSSSPAWGGTFRIILVLSGVALLRICAMMDGSSSSTEPPPPIAVERSAWSADAAVELFGEQVDEDTLSAQAPDLHRTINRASAQYDVDLDRDTQATATLLQQLRLLTLMAARDADFEELVAIKQVKLDLMRIAREQGGSSECIGYSRVGLFQSDLEVGEEVRAEERAIAARLLAAGRLRPSTVAFPTEASIPASVVDRIRQTTGFSRETMDSAAVGEGSESIQCDYRIALLAAVLRRPGDVSDGLLRMM